VKRRILMSYKKAGEAFKRNQELVNPTKEAVWYDLNLGLENLTEALSQDLNLTLRSLQSISKMLRETRPK